MPAIAPLVASLGIAQIISWGTLFYAIGVLGTPMRTELGVSDVFLFGAFTAGLLVSGVLAPLAGRRIDRDGGRAVLCAGSIVGTLAMAVLAWATSPALMVAGWLLAGAAMAGVLYDPAFAALSYHVGEGYRRAVTILTLFGGFASTVFWPLSQVLFEAIGWRGTFALYALMHLLVCLPIHAFMIPRSRGAAAPVAARGPVAPAPAPDPPLRGLAAAFGIATFVFGIVAVHLINLLTAAGVPRSQAVAMSMLVGPMQVAGRVVELMVARRVRPAHVGAVAFALMALAVAALMAVRGPGAAALLFVAAYGCGNGLLTIAKGTVPAELYGRQGLGGLLGYIARAGMFAKAVAPAAWPALLALGLARPAALAALLAVAAAGWATYAWAVRARLHGVPPARV
ncbi:MAG TPA: MFS transporter [Usitatibacter sp.]|jgi:predicted MFS family arabinose efflux permease|nr:MFS transporter [Usitatibacter sp.]